VQQIVQQSGVDPRQLTFEVTEKVVLENLPETFKTMHALTALGIRFSLDDFGTGYSSLSHLSQLPINQLKIDRVFIRHLPESQSDVLTVQAIISIGKNFGLDIIAEGVETEPQRVFLRDHGCHAYQGRLASPPLPLEEFEQFLLH
jgi:EAL domain-containing protein (putative c-di-GMP-specific phosphodiesterase class I)